MKFKIYFFKSQELFFIFYIHFSSLGWIEPKRFVYPTNFTAAKKAFNKKTLFFHKSYIQLKRSSADFGMHLIMDMLSIYGIEPARKLNIPMKYIIPFYVVKR